MTHDWVPEIDSDSVRCITRSGCRCPECGREAAAMSAVMVSQLLEDSSLIPHFQELNEATVRSLIERGCPHNGVTPS